MIGESGIERENWKLGWDEKALGLNRFERMEKY
jgi:hypothetical protein